MCNADLPCLRAEGTDKCRCRCHGDRRLSAWPCDPQPLCTAGCRQAGRLWALPPSSPPPPVAEMVKSMFWKKLNPSRLCSALQAQAGASPPHAHPGWHGRASQVFFISSHSPTLPFLGGRVSPTLPAPKQSHPSLYPLSPLRPGFLLAWALAQSCVF